MQSGVSIGTYEKDINVVPGTYVVPGDVNKDAWQCNPSDRSYGTA